MKTERRKELGNLLIIWFLFISTGIWIATMPESLKAKLFDWVNSLAR